MFDIIKNWIILFLLDLKHIHKVNFYPSDNNFTQALLVMLVTNINSALDITLILYDYDLLWLLVMISCTLTLCLLSLKGEPNFSEIIHSTKMKFCTAAVFKTLVNTAVHNSPLIWLWPLQSTMKVWIFCKYQKGKLLKQEIG